MKAFDFHSAKVGSVSLIYSGLVFFLSAGVTVPFVLAIFFALAFSAETISSAFWAVMLLLLPYTRIMYYDLPCIALFVPPIFGLVFDKARMRSLLVLGILSVSVLMFRVFAYMMEGNLHGEDIYHLR